MSAAISVLILILLSSVGAHGKNDHGAPPAPNPENIPLSSLSILSTAIDEIEVLEKDPSIGFAMEPEGETSGPVDEKTPQDPVRQDLFAAEDAAGLPRGSLLPIIADMMRNEKDSSPPPDAKPSQDINVLQQAPNSNGNSNVSANENENDSRSVATNKEIEFPRRTIPPQVARAFRIIEERIRSGPTYDDRRRIWDSVKDKLEVGRVSGPHRGIAALGGSDAGIRSGPRVPFRSKNSSETEDRVRELIDSASAALSASVDASESPGVAGTLGSGGSTGSNGGQVLGPGPTKVAGTTTPFASAIANQNGINLGPQEYVPQVRKRPSPDIEYGNAVVSALEENSPEGVTEFPTEDSRSRKLLLAMQYFQALQEARTKQESTSGPPGTTMRGREIASSKSSIADYLTGLPAHLFYGLVNEGHQSTRMPATVVVENLRRTTGISETQAWRLYYFINALAWIASLWGIYWLMSRLRYPLFLAFLRAKERRPNQ